MHTKTQQICKKCSGSRSLHLGISLSLSTAMWGFKRMCRVGKESLWYGLNIFIFKSNKVIDAMFTALWLENFFSKKCYIQGALSSILCSWLLADFLKFETSWYTYILLRSLGAAEILVIIFSHKGAYEPSHNDVLLFLMLMRWNLFCIGTITAAS